MAERGSSRRPVLALSIALGAALLLIAFLLGRESARGPAPDAVDGELSPRPVAQPGAEPAADEESTRRWPDWADPRDRDDSERRTTDSTVVTAERLERPADNTLHLSNSGAGPNSQSTSRDSPPEQRQVAVAAYFQEIDAIQSGEGAGDPNAFAMGLLKAGLGGSTAGFDQLIADTRHMEQEMQRVTPPPSCESYHKASLEGIVESRQMLESLKQAVSDRDIGQLNAIALHGESLQRKTQAMEDMRKQILASEGAY